MYQHHDIMAQYLVQSLVHLRHGLVRHYLLTELSFTIEKALSTLLRW